MAFPDNPSILSSTMDDSGFGLGSLGLEVVGCCLLVASIVGLVYVVICGFRWKLSFRESFCFECLYFLDPEVAHAKCPECGCITGTKARLGYRRRCIRAGIISGLVVVVPCALGLLAVDCLRVSLRMPFVVQCTMARLEFFVEGEPGVWFAACHEAAAGSGNRADVRIGLWTDRRIAGAVAKQSLRADLGPHVRNFVTRALLAGSLSDEVACRLLEARIGTAFVQRLDILSSFRIPVSYPSQFGVLLLPKIDGLDESMVLAFGQVCDSPGVYYVGSRLRLPRGVVPLRSLPGQPYGYVYQMINTGELQAVLGTAWAVELARLACRDLEVDLIVGVSTEHPERRSYLGVLRIPLSDLFGFQPGVGIGVERPDVVRAAASFRISSCDELKTERSVSMATQEPLRTGPWIDPRH